MNRRRKAARAGQRGFTLLDALVATLLMGIILAALASVTAQWLPNWDRGISGVQRTEMLALGLERLIADLAAAEIVTTGPQATQPVFEGATLSVTFVRTAIGPSVAPGLELVRIAETGGGRSPTLVRTRAPFTPIVPGSFQTRRPEFTNPVTMVPAPYRVSFAYMGSDQVWKDTWTKMPELPRMIRILVRDGGTGRILPMSTIVKIHAEISARCATAKTINECHANDASSPKPGAPGEPTQARAQTNGSVDALRAEPQ